MKDYFHEFKKDAPLLVYDLESEKAVLGTLMSESTVYNEYCNMLSEDSFYDCKHQDIYRAIKSVAQKGEEPELIGVSQELQRMASDVSLAELLPISSAGVWSDINRNVAYLVELCNRRKLFGIYCKLYQCATNMNVDYDDTMNEVKTALLDIEGQAMKKARTLADCIDLVYQRINDNLNPDKSSDATMTGYDMIDNKGGINGGDLIVSVAGTSQGKTAFAISVMLNVMSQNKKILFHSMEMTEEQIGNRIVASLSGISCNVIRHSLQESQIMDIDKGIGKLGANIHNLIVDDSSSQSIDRILSSIRSHKYKYGINGVVIDYLQMLDCNLRVMTKEQAMAYAARRLKNIAKELDIWIIALSQINRNPSEDNAPSIGKIRDSGQIAEAADVVLTIYRPEVYGKNFPKPFEEYDPKGLALVKIEKGRNIGTGEFLCGFDADTTKFYQLDLLGLEQHRKDGTRGTIMPF